MEINKWVKMTSWDDYPKGIDDDYKVWIWTTANLYTIEQYEYAVTILARDIKGLYYMIKKINKPKRPKQLN